MSPAPPSIAALRARVRPVLEHRMAGPVLTALVAYVALVEVGVQLVFGQLRLGPVSLGLGSLHIPTEAFVSGAIAGTLYALIGDWGIIGLGAIGLAIALHERRRSIHAVIEA